MPTMKDDATSTQNYNRYLRRAIEEIVILRRGHVFITCGNTETPVRMPIPAYYLGVNDIGAILKEIMALVNGEERDEDGIVRPTPFAVDRTTSLLHAACNAYPIKFPLARVAPDLEGGLRIEWKSAKGVVRLVVPPRGDQREYLYARFGGKSQTEFSLTGEVLAAWLDKVA